MFEPPPCNTVNALGSDVVVLSRLATTSAYDPIGAAVRSNVAVIVRPSEPMAGALLMIVEPPTSLTDAPLWNPPPTMVIVTAPVFPPDVGESEDIESVWTLPSGNFVTKAACG